MTIDRQSDEQRRLFGQWLKATRELQQDAYQVDYSQFDDVDALVKYIKDMYIATMQEMGELLDETSWKPWASDESFVNRPLVIKEAVDALHFIGNILAALQCTDDELNEQYIEKMGRNRDRQLREGGYKVRDVGSDKCEICRRALDDVGVSPNSDTVCRLCSPATARSVGE